VLTKGRESKIQYVQPEIEMLAKTAFPDLLPEILVGRGKDPDIDLVRGLAAYRGDDLVLEHTEDFGLHFQRHIADLIEEQCSAICFSNFPDAS
jgi:hypothetical protein